MTINLDVRSFAEKALRRRMPFTSVPNSCASGRRIFAHRFACDPDTKKTRLRHDRDCWSSPCSHHDSARRLPHAYHNPRQLKALCVAAVTVLVLALSCACTARAEQAAATDSKENLGVVIGIDLGTTCVLSFVCTLPFCCLPPRRVLNTCLEADVQRVCGPYSWIGH